MLEETVRKLAKKGVTEYRAGGARGFDMLAAQTVLRLKKEIPALRLVIKLPYKQKAGELERRGKGASRGNVCAGRSTSYIAEHYTRGCMQRRNRELVEGSGYCVSYCTRDTGGTAYTVAYARKNGLEIINLADWLP